jgi:polyisoprenoid-binding protein YceI
MGHDLTIEISQWSAQVDVPGGDRATAKITAEIDLGSLAVREGTGGAMPLTPSDRKDIEATARKVLGANGQSMAHFESTQVVRNAGGGVINGTLTLRGVSRPIHLQIRQTGDDQYQGTAAVVQSAYGIKPYSAFMGALKLRDEVTVEVEVDLSKATGPARSA